jgi:serine protease Do
MTRNSFISATAFVWLALVASSPLLRAALAPEDLYSAVSPSIVTLEVENVAGKRFVGSAFLAVGDGLAVTAWHLVHDARRVEARFSDNHRVKVAGLVDHNDQLDLALIKLETSGRPRLKLATAAPRIGARVYIVGAPRGFDFSISEGLLSQVRTLDAVRYYQVSCPISPGDSGGPVLNDRGEAIAVVSWRKADAENLGFAVPSPAVARLYSSFPALAWADSPSSSSPPTSPNEPTPYVRTSLPAVGLGATNTYSDFLHYLSARAGEQVTVIIQEQRGKESHFSFEVPKQAPK